MCPSLVPREIADGVVALEEQLGPRRLQQYALADAGGWLLFDAGIPGSVTSRLERGELGAVLQADGATALDNTLDALQTLATRTDGGVIA